MIHGSNHLTLMKLKIYINSLRIIIIYCHLLNKLEILNPLLTLKRGYSIVKKDSRVVTSVKNVKKGDNINIELKDGNISANVV